MRKLDVVVYVSIALLALLAALSVTMGCLHPHKRCTHVVSSDSSGTYHKTVCEWEEK